MTLLHKQQFPLTIYGKMSLRNYLANRKLATVSLNISSDFNKKFAKWMQQYEDFVGLTDVKNAQRRVLEAETKFVDSQDLRREMQRKIGGIQERLREVHTELDRTNRGEDKYLALVTQEHSIIKEEKKLREDFQSIEKEERENFAALSHAVRDSHEKERAQAEKTKYWSIIGSVAGTLIGIFGTTINNRLRMQELRELVQDTAKSSSSLTSPDDLAQHIVSLISNTKPNADTVSQTSQSSFSANEKLIESFNNLSLKLEQQIGSFRSQYEEQQHRVESLILSGKLNEEDRPLIVNGNELQLVLQQHKQELLKTVFFSTLFATAVSWAVIKLMNF